MKTPFYLLFFLAAQFNFGFLSVGTSILDNFCPNWLAAALPNRFSSSSIAPSAMDLSFKLLCFDLALPHSANWGKNCPVQSLETDKLCQLFQLQIDPLSRKIQKEITKRVKYQYNQKIVVARVNEKKTRFFHAGTYLFPPEEMIFEIGSMTKLFTAHLTLLLEQEGVLSLEDEIDRYLPSSIHVPQYENSKIKILHLLTHTSGLQDPETENYLNPQTGNTVIAAEYTIEDLYEHLNHTVLSTHPGAVASYSNLGYGLMGHILERVSGKDYYTLLKEKILTPLGMNHTYVHIPESELTKLVQGSEAGQPAPLWEIPHLPAFASLKSTASDLALYLKALIFTHPKPANREIMNKLMSPYLEPEELPIAITYGGTIEKRYGSNFFAVAGRTLGFSCFMGFCPKKREAILLLTDASSLDDLGHHWINPLFPIHDLYRTIAQTQSTLKKLEGNYRQEGKEDQTQCTIMAHESYLELASPGEKAVRLYPSSPHSFFTRYFDSSNFPVRFEEREHKIYMILDAPGEPFIFKRED